ncbi:MAG: LptE family protein [Bacteroidales bacterium]|nr:LptE family protein [Bacteroidales bacterium]
MKIKSWFNKSSAIGSICQNKTLVFFRVLVSVFRRAPFICLLYMLIFLNSCNYSFTGASIAADVKTISVTYFQNQASYYQPTVSRLFTEALRDKYQSQTSLNLKDKNGDLQIDGAITDYSVQPVAIQSNEKAALNRLTITIRVSFINTKDEKQNFETTFSRFEDYDSKLNLASIEENLIKKINDMLVEDVFNKTVVNW